MKSAIIGLGVIAALHVDAIRDACGEIVAVCDIDLVKAEKFIQTHNLNSAIYQDYKQLLDTEEIDVVHICTPHYLHADMSVYALEKNVNVLCEKPICINRVDFERILTAEKNSKAQIGICFQNRYKNTNKYVCELLKDQKKISAVASVAWNRGEEYYASGAWRGKKATEGGAALINQAIHTLDLMLSFCGTPTKVWAMQDNFHLQGIIDVEDVITIRALTEKGGFVMTATTASIADMEVLIQIKTPEYKVIMNGNDIYVNGEKVAIEQDNGYAIKPCYGLGHYPLVQDFYDCIVKKRKFKLDASEGLKVMDAVLSIYESAEKN